MRSYETAVIWSASIPEKELDDELSRLMQVISESSGTPMVPEKWGRRTLAYPIDKQTEGVYHFVKWDGGPEVIEAIDKHLRIHEGCLRYLNVRRDDEPGEEPVRDAGDGEEQGT